MPGEDLDVLEPFPRDPLLRTHSSPALTNMRKYYKLALMVVTVLSLVCFAFYKTQYDRLYKVLQVLEYFGNDGDGR